MPQAGPGVGGVPAELAGHRPLTAPSLLPTPTPPLFSDGPRPTVVSPKQDFRVKMRGVYEHSDARLLTDTFLSQAVLWSFAGQVSPEGRAIQPVTE